MKIEGCWTFYAPRNLHGENTAIFLHLKRFGDTKKPYVFPEFSSLDIPYDSKDKHISVGQQPVAGPAAIAVAAPGTIGDRAMTETLKGQVIRVTGLKYLKTLTDVLKAKFRGQNYARIGGIDVSRVVGVAPGVAAPAGAVIHTEPDWLEYLLSIHGTLLSAANTTQNFLMEQFGVRE